MSERYYVIDKFAEADVSLKSIIEAMPIKRKAIDVYRQKNSMQRAKDTYADLEGLKQKLLDIVKNLRLLFSEADITDGAEFANKLYAAAKDLHLKCWGWIRTASPLVRKLMNFGAKKRKHGWTAWALAAIFIQTYAMSLFMRYS